MDATPRKTTKTLKLVNRDNGKVEASGLHPYDVNAEQNALALRGVWTNKVEE